MAWPVVCCPAQWPPGVFPGEPTGQTGARTGGSAAPAAAPLLPRAPAGRGAAARSRCSARTVPPRGGGPGQRPAPLALPGPALTRCLPAPCRSRVTAAGARASASSRGCPPSNPSIPGRPVLMLGLPQPGSTWPRLRFSRASSLPRPLWIPSLRENPISPSPRLSGESAAPHRRLRVRCVVAVFIPAFPCSRAGDLSVSILPSPS